jgi:hypothetical protein
MFNLNWKLAPTSLTPAPDSLVCGEGEFRVAA